ncbi:MAG: hypothetical protein EA428_13550 [Spirochaetaceae bacterium]|nr:MAG: hypothetical protein EA428_13550 [Spirochaetaceae bacterium]
MNAHKPSLVTAALSFSVFGALALIVYAGGAGVAASAVWPEGFMPTEQVLVAAALGLWVLGLVYAALREGATVLQQLRDGPRTTAPEGATERASAAALSLIEFPTDALNFLAVFVGAVLTYWISVDMAVGAVVASALVGVCAATLFKAHAVPAFAGSFVGMASPELFGYSGILLAGAIAGLAFVASKRVFNGYGGKLGTTAWAGCLGAALLLGQPMLSVPVPAWEIGGLLVLYSVAGAVLTFVLSVRFAQGPVMASSLVGLAAGLILPSFHGPALGATLAVMVFCASFAGMSGTVRFRHARFMVPAGVMCALAFMYSAPFLGGAGGKLGTIAFGSVIGLHGLIGIAERLRQIVLAQTGPGTSVAGR